MNKDVIYIEAEDDITDIISKIEASKERIVALVPPKNSGILKSIVNIKLILKSGQSLGKNIVLVTTEESIIKLAAVVKLPVTKNLQSAPSIPTEKTEEIEENTSKEEVVEEKSVIKVTDNAKEDVKPEENEEESYVDKITQLANEKAKEKEEKTEDKKSKEKSKKAEKTEKTSNPFINWLKVYKKWLIIGFLTIAVATLVAIWAFVIAPSVNIEVDIRTTSANFSESISLVSDKTLVDTDNGVFLIEEIKNEETEIIEVEATGEKNVGEKASGVITLTIYLDPYDSTSLNAGSPVVVDGLTFYTVEDVLFYVDDNTTSCQNKNKLSELQSKGCLLYEDVDVIAAEAGIKYNIAAASNWKTNNASIGAFSSTNMTGGTDSIVKIVSEEDINKAKKEFEESQKKIQIETETKLINKAGTDKFRIPSTFEQTITIKSVTPEINSEIENEEKIKIEFVTSSTVKSIDEVRLKEFITLKAKITEDQKIYSINDKNTFVEGLVQTDSGYAGKLKTSYKFGPKITDNDILEKVKGKGIGDIQHILKSIDGVSGVVIEKSYPWVNSAPNDSNKITIKLNFEGE